MQAQLPNHIENRPETESRKRTVLGPIMSSLGWPLVVGLVGFWTFLFFVDKGYITHELLVRYLYAHPVSYVATAMFFVGIASLLMKLANVCLQIRDQKNIRLSPQPALAQGPESSSHLLAELDELSIARQESYLGKRLRNALEFVDKTETANGLEDELKYLADVDAEKQQESFALTRILIWAIPMLGFLGTVIGISGALGGLSVEADFNTMLSGLKEKLYVAFDTTALALTLSIVLMFAQFIVNRIEQQLLNAVNETASEELVGRFVTYGSNRDPYLASVENMSQRVLVSMSEIGSQQSAVWDRGLQSIQQTTEAALGSFAELLADRLSKQLDPIMDEFGISIRSAISDSNRYMEQHSGQLSEAVHNSVAAVGERNQELAAALSGFSQQIREVISSQSEGIRQTMADSDGVLNSHLARVHQVMEQTVQLVEGQSQQISGGIESSRQVMDQHCENLKQVFLASSQAMEEHTRRIDEAVVQSEEIVDKRQETIARTQESMLKAQSQQSMAISNFTEKLQTLQEIVEKSDALGKVQATLAETLSSLEKSDTLANELHGLARLIQEQIKSVDRQQLTMAESNENQLRVMIEQTQIVVDENAKRLKDYHAKTDHLVTTLLDATRDRSATESMQRCLEETFDGIADQLANQNRTLSSLGEQLKRSLDPDFVAAQLSRLIEASLQEANQTFDFGPQMAAVVKKLESVQSAYERPSQHQKQFLAQQKQTIDNQNQLLDFCQTLEVNNRSAFLETANRILEKHSESAGKAVQLEETVRELTFSVNLLHQSLASQTGKAAEETLQFSQPEVPKRVA